MNGDKGSSATRIALVEDNERFGAQILGAIAAASDLHVAAQARSLAEGMALLQQEPIDILLVDLGLPDGSGIELIRAARQIWSGCQIMVLSVFGDETNVIRSLEAGAQGYLLKDMTAERIVEEIRSLREGESPISPRIARHLLTRLIGGANTRKEVVQETTSTNENKLSARELEVLNHIAKGFTYDEIAGRMAVSRHTVLTYVRRIYAKFEVHTKIEALNKARSQGLVSE